MQKCRFPKNITRYFIIDLYVSLPNLFNEHFEHADEQSKTPDFQLIFPLQAGFYSHNRRAANCTCRGYAP